MIELNPKMNITPIDQMHGKVFPRESLLHQGFRPQHLKASDILNHVREACDTDERLFLECCCYMICVFETPHEKIATHITHDALSALYIMFSVIPKDRITRDKVKILMRLLHEKEAHREAMSLFEEYMLAHEAVHSTGEIIRVLGSEERVAKLLCGVVTGRIQGFAESEKKSARNTALEEILEINYHEHTLSTVDVEKIDTLFRDGKSLREVVAILKNGFAFSDTRV